MTRFQREQSAADRITTKSTLIAFPVPEKNDEPGMTPAECDALLWSAVETLADEVREMPRVLRNLQKSKST
jgi:hypothetical protein